MPKAASGSCPFSNHILSAMIFRSIHFAASLAAAAVVLFRSCEALDYHCPLLTLSECSNCPEKCAWNSTVSACEPSNGGVYNYTKGNGVIELEQTRVVKATGETRRAPELVAEREAEMLVTPTDLPLRRLASPTSAPTTGPIHEWGLEQQGVLEVELASSSDTWPPGYPRDERALLAPGAHHKPL